MYLLLIIIVMANKLLRFKWDIFEENKYFGECECNNGEDKQREDNKNVRECDKEYGGDER